MRGRTRGSRRDFSLRRTTVGFALAAVLLGVGGMLLRSAWQSVGGHPAVRGALVLLVLAGAVALLRRRRRRRHAARLAAAVTEAAEELVDTALAEIDEAVEAEAVAGPVFVPGPAPAPEPAPVDFAALDPYAFEEAVAELCRRDGCRDAEVVGGAGDLGADVLATTPDGRRLVVQCKRYGPANKVGSQDLQRFGGTCYAVHGAEVAVVVSTGEFTAPATEYAAACGILCVDAEALAGWSGGALPPPWELPAALGGTGLPEPV
ncbi:restriction endonuclease [Streptomyces sp. NBC_00102]|uniref:restriction endonuclease n=1 Tax=Streptomyces sp. NBC_00102 TaxID=2975652 RepID=UPI00225422D0|nr:restriction endonuclease [Streptomyces sp. NBC_00102]MCX5400900.1 restriction endonuclease [Streptomyces sp. NBC_00102]